MYWPSGTVACGMRPDEHAIGITFVFRNIRLQPLDHDRDVLALVSRTPASLHIYADHSVLGGPPANLS